MGERRARSFHMTCRLQRDYGSRLVGPFARSGPNGYAGTSLSLDQEMDADNSPPVVGKSEAPMPDMGLYAPVSLELDSAEFNNGSGVPQCPMAKDPALRGQVPVALAPLPPPLPRSSWMHHHQKEFQRPYVKTSMQGDVYNFLERPAGLKCFLYHFLV